jgi:hypothetical protein
MQKGGSAGWAALFCLPEADSQWVNFVTIPRDEDNTYKDYLADYWEGNRIGFKPT